MPKCTLHPGRNSVTTILTKEYCAQCRDGIKAARLKVDGHVEPKSCFIWYVSNDKWAPIDGTGCAHWVAHQLNLHVGLASERCLDGFTYRVKTLIHSRTAIKLATVKVNDIWANDKLDHMGLVLKVAPPAKAGGPPVITIRHDSSAQGKVSDNDWAVYFHSGGSFYR